MTFDFVMSRKTEDGALELMNIQFGLVRTNPSVMKELVEKMDVRMRGLFRVFARIAKKWNLNHSKNGEKPLKSFHLVCILLDWAEKYGSLSLRFTTLLFTLFNHLTLNIQSNFPNPCVSRSPNLERKPSENWSMDELKEILSKARNYCKIASEREIDSPQACISPLTSLLGSEFGDILKEELKKEGGKLNTP
eukprot:CAMPEP_0201509304 /NCGR_PEP_ID=MMETSP0161_2-20130828/2404_1 /ASSEMBLY_ACC=CAM_ASM_000251 /TAXON_ID=180227 /ORGANISM="Neoparamoeba aestuarina, Strain SoJaBio B1-5/56/2" /LENGTH=191 /DNA_ID=CAMNT_0047904223 /DNA_START=86 /DNA_END=657 /DNA_ORIENTATION=-